jgi:hypothetical protein
MILACHLKQRLTTIIIIITIIITIITTSSISKPSSISHRSSKHQPIISNSSSKVPNTVLCTQYQNWSLRQRRLRIQIMITVPVLCALVVD